MCIVLIHRLNLITVDICKGLVHGKTFFDVLEELYGFISGSPVHTKFIETQLLLNPKRKPIELKKKKNVMDSASTSIFCI
jgi:hypothetical protein